MPISIPSLQVTTKAVAKGSARVFIQSRQDATHPGTFDLKIDVRFNPAVDDYAVLGTLTITSRLTDSTGPATVTFTATTVDLTNSYGKHNPTIYITGRCRADSQELKGCKDWLLIANNKGPNDQGTPDVIGFAVIDRNGNRVAYGTGPVQAGDLLVDPQGV